MVSETARQFPFPVVVRTITTLPAVVSAALGVYTAFIVIVSGEKIPVPNVVQPPPVETVNEPLRVTVALLEHTVWFTPAFAIGEEVNDTSMVSVTGLHVPLLAEVSTNNTLPPETSEVLGVYVVLSELLLTKVPVPIVVHNPEPVLEDPLKKTIALLEQTV
jgi:hypothetical protein